MVDRKQVPETEGILLFPSDKRPTPAQREQAARYLELIAKRIREDAMAEGALPVRSFQVNNDLKYQPIDPPDLLVSGRYVDRRIVRQELTLRIAWSWEP